MTANFTLETLSVVTHPSRGYSAFLQNGRVCASSRGAALREFLLGEADEGEGCGVKDFHNFDRWGRSSLTLPTLV